MKNKSFDRRSVLRTLGLGVVSSAAIPGTVSSHKPGGPSNKTFAWSNHELWEMLELDGGEDESGDHPSLYLIESMADESVNGAVHSPHDTVPYGRPPDVPVDYVIDASDPSVRSVRQWDVKMVVGSGGILPEPENFVEGIGYLTSVDAINEAAAGSDPAVEIRDADILRRIDDFVHARPIREH